MSYARRSRHPHDTLVRGTSGYSDAYAVKSQRARLWRRGRDV